MKLVGRLAPQLGVKPLRLYATLGMDGRKVLGISVPPSVVDGDNSCVAWFLLPNGAPSGLLNRVIKIAPMESEPTMTRPSTKAAAAQLTKEPTPTKTPTPPSMDKPAPSHVAEKGQSSIKSTYDVNQNEVKTSSPVADKLAEESPTPNKSTCDVNRKDVKSPPGKGPPTKSKYRRLAPFFDRDEAAALDATDEANGGHNSTAWRVHKGRKSESNGEATIAEKEAPLEAPSSPGNCAGGKVVRFFFIAEDQKQTDIIDHLVYDSEDYFKVDARSFDLVLPVSQ